MRLLLVAALFFSLVLAVNASAVLTCRAVNISQSACDVSNPDPEQKEFILLNMTDYENAHAALPNSPSEPVLHKINICCRGIKDLSTGTNRISWLMGASNTHASLNTSYPYSVNMSSPFANITVSPVLAASTSDNANATCNNANYDACAFSVSDFDNAHVGDCFNYKQSGLQATGGRVYAVCLNSSCRQNDCQNGYRCFNKEWVLNDTDGNGIDEACEASFDCTSSFYALCPSGVCRACINGTVFGSDIGPLAGARVETMPFANSSLTNNNGSYFMALPENNYTLVASKETYTPGIKNLFIPAAVTTTVNFLLGHGPNDCLADCTRDSNGGVCDKSCDGTNGCVFYDDIAANACNNWKSGFRRPYSNGTEIQCCDGAPYAPRAVKPSPTKTNATVVARVTRMVWYEGKFVKMVVDVFG